jgi:tRNA dimethylallyltransferase
VVQETPVIAIFGPTASGKTQAALTIAGRLGGEIVSVDSGQIYRGLSIGTAKPTASEREKVPFHLIDVADPSEAFSAARFRESALPVLDDLRSRGRRAILTVGTGLYFRALEEGLFEGPQADPVLRARLEKRLQDEGIAVLEDELKKVDPEAAKSVPKNNRQRVLRALEVFYLTGTPISEHWRSHRNRMSGKSKTSRIFLKLGLSPAKSELDRRIEDRVEGMIEQGLLAEARGLWELWGTKAPGLRLIGYKEIVSYLEGRITLEESISLVIRNTKQYAKRQRTWFKKDREIQWFEGVDTLTQRLTKE